MQDKLLKLNDFQLHVFFAIMHENYQFGTSLLRDLLFNILIDFF